ncbi:MAG: phosphatase PAP2 family protein [Treponema sp.]|nr:phosphatase PAP2 family protein [Treponema sp.]
MENILHWELGIIQFIQRGAGQPLTTLMIGITQLGSAAAYLILIPLIYWCINEKKGFVLGLVILISAWLNLTLKFVLNQPRPFFAGFDPSLQMVPEKLGGLPSGHAQNALVMWIIIASWVRKKWAYAGAAIICLAVSFSRVYLGVHFPTDILGGWIAGGIVLCVYFLFNGKIEELLDKGGYRAQIISIAILSFIMLFYRPSDDFLLQSAILLGMGAGYIINKKSIQFKSAITLQYKPLIKLGIAVIRFLLGITVTVLVFVIFRKIIPSVRETSYYQIVYFFQYALIGLWVTAGAPWLFGILHLAEKGQKAIEE